MSDPQSPHRRLATRFSKALNRELPSILHEWRSAADLQDDLDALLEIELLRCEEMAFAEGFAHACPVDECVAEDYLQRVVSIDADQFLLTGIRFHQLLNFTFIDIIASTKPIDSPAELAETIDALRATYAKFSPQAVRLIRALERPLDPPNHIEASIDQYIIAGSLDLLVTQPSPPALRNLSLEAIVDASEAADFVDSAYRAFFEQHPKFSEMIHPADEDDIKNAQARGAAFYILADTTRAGLIATVNDLGPLGRGQMVVEEVLGAAFRGHRLGAPAQRLVIDVLSKKYPDDIIWGTVDAANAASLATAKSAGRQLLSAWHWLRWA